MFLQLLLLGTIQFVHSDREHKVHNIVLYPERHSWCQTTPIKQVVAFPGYEPLTIDNNVCVGACYSYSIPRTQPAEPGELIGPYCDSCQPTETRCYHVTLKTDGKNADDPQVIQKRVQIITNCTCKSCETIKDNKDCQEVDQTTSELPSDLFQHLNNETQIDSTNTSRISNLTDDREPYEKLMGLLRNLQEDDTSTGVDYSKLKELLQAIDSGKHISDRVLSKFITFINLHDDVDLIHLKSTLNDFRNQELLERHRVFGLGLANSIERNTLEEHHEGEQVNVGGDTGHLMAGPRGSLIFAPDSTVEEKLSLEPHMVKPNHEGVVLTYENHQQKRRHGLFDD